MKISVRKKRFDLLQKFGFKCQYCGKSPKTDSTVELEIDHRIPRSKGGTDDDSNLVVCCTMCNLGKGSRLLEDDIDFTHRPQAAKKNGKKFSCDCGAAIEVSRTIKRGRKITRIRRCILCGRMYLTVEKIYARIKIKSVTSARVEEQSA